MWYNNNNPFQHAKNMQQTTLKTFEIAHHEQYVFLSQCFQNASSAEATESIYMYKRINHLPLTDYRLLLMYPVK